MSRRWSESPCKSYRTKRYAPFGFGLRVITRLGQQPCQIEKVSHSFSIGASPLFSCASALAFNGILPVETSAGVTVRTNPSSSNLLEARSHPCLDTCHARTSPSHLFLNIQTSKLAQSVQTFQRRPGPQHLISPIILLSVKIANLTEDRASIPGEHLP